MVPNIVKRRKVRFSVCRFSYIEPPEYDSTLDCKSLFYTLEDLVKMKQEAKATIKLIHHGLPVREDQGMCSRGLECRTPKGARKLALNQARARKTVLEEQVRQQESGISSPEKIAALYKQVCNECQDEARATAIQDSIRAKDSNKQRPFVKIIGKHDSTLRYRIEHAIQWKHTAVAF